MPQDLRSYLDGLRQTGDLVTIPSPVAARHDLAAVLNLLEGGPAVWFAQVVGYDMPVVANVANSRHRIASALGVGAEAIGAALLDAIDRPLPTSQLTTGPCQEVVTQADLTALPIPEFFEKESGPYVTAGVIVVRDVLTGERNLSFARLKVLGPRRAMLGVSPNHHLGAMARRAASAGQDLPVAVAIGTHPAIMVAACLYLGFGADELECAGRLLGEPVDVVRAVDSDVLLPAHAELVLEGVVRTGELVDEGLVSEFHGHYHHYGRGYVVELSTTTHRKDPVLQVIQPGLHSEHVLLGGVAIAAGLLAQLREIEPNVVDVAVPEVGAGRTALVVAVRDIAPGQADALIQAGLSLVKLIKQVVVVDAEIDPWNAEAVEWARLCHARAERDLTVVPDAPTDRSDPLERDLRVGKLGVDATRKPGERAVGWDFARVPDPARARALALLADLGLPPQQSRLLSGIRRQ